MMPNIELSSSTYKRLVQHSVSFEDTAEDVIERLLDETDANADIRESPVKEALRRRISRAAPGSILPEREYWKPILGFLAESGGSASASEVIEALGERLRDAFTPRDFEALEMGEVRWRNRARFARLRMTQKGLLNDASPRGIWEITDAGRQFLEPG